MFVADFSGIFKLVLILTVIVAILAFIFVKSDTLEVRSERVMRNGMPYDTNRYILHWDRFGAYVKSIPRRLKGLLTTSSP